jgi:hypothetical protein
MGPLMQLSFQGSAEKVGHVAHLPVVWYHFQNLVKQYSVSRDLEQNHTTLLASRLSKCSACAFSKAAVSLLASALKEEREISTLPLQAR